jgi:hypothetical protein
VVDRIRHTVTVYRNLHRGDWSVKNTRTGLVVRHAASVALRDVTLRVSEAGRQRVLREQSKNVHAGVVGSESDYPREGVEWVPVTYNPYQHATFVRRDTGEPVLSARYARFGAGLEVVL